MLKHQWVRKHINTLERFKHITETRKGCDVKLNLFSNVKYRGGQETLQHLNTKTHNQWAFHEENLHHMIWALRSFPVFSSLCFALGSFLNHLNSGQAVLLLVSRGPETGHTKSFQRRFKSHDHSKLYIILLRKTTQRCKNNLTIQTSIIFLECIL